MNDDIVKNDSFNYEGYQVVRGEFFAHTHEPSLTFNKCKVYVNTACIKKLPDTQYVQILINAENKKLAVKPCCEDAKDSFLWCSISGQKRRPKQISCQIFFAKLVELMNWNPDYRYKLLGKLIRSQEELLFIFDLKTPEIFQRILQEDGKQRVSQTPSFPAEWHNQFGLTFEEHRESLQINIFEGYAVFGIKNHSEDKTYE